ncbi:MAG: hypothetical protein QXU18_10195 [Thermoplasmatales archaeon]
MAEFNNGLKDNNNRSNSFHDPGLSIRIDRIIISSSLRKKKEDLSLARKAMLAEKVWKIRNSKKLSKRKKPVKVSPEMK